jgi:hypothetical protein
LSEALEITSEQFARLVQLSHQYNFVCEIYLIEPMEDVSRGTYPRTARAVTAIAHGLPVVDLGPVLERDPGHYYYCFDGHFTPAGHRVAGRFLLQKKRGPVVK